MEPQNCSMVPIVGMESRRFWTVRIQNRQHMGHATRTVEREFLKSADRQHRKGDRLHFSDIGARGRRV
jgi:hypothetical protein